MKFDVVTIFPRMIEAGLAEGVVGRGIEKGLVDVRVHDLRAFTSDRHRTVDDVPYGGTVTYGEIAARIGAPRAAVRAVGGAIGANPLLIVRPCHRVIGADGSLTGYAGGLERKVRLLTHEGALPRP